MFSDPVNESANSMNPLWYQPPVGNNRLLRESYEIDPRMDDVTPLFAFPVIAP